MTTGRALKDSDNIIPLAVAHKYLHTYMHIYIIVVGSPRHKTAVCLAIILLYYVNDIETEGHSTVIIFISFFGAVEFHIILYVLSYVLECKKKICCIIIIIIDYC